MIQDLKKIVKGEQQQMENLENIVVDEQNSSDVITSTLEYKYDSVEKVEDVEEEDSSNAPIDYVKKDKNDDDDSEEDKNSDMWKWVQMVHDRFIKALEWFNIFPIPSLHESPDTLMHEPIWMQPTEDKKLKWKIIQVFEQGFYYQKENGDKLTIFPSKVVIWQ